MPIENIMWWNFENNRKNKNARQQANNCRKRQRSCLKPPRRPPQQHQYWKDVGWGRNGRLVRENLFDILTRSCGREQCADIGHLTNTLYIIHQQKPAPEEGCRAQFPGSAAASRPEISDINLMWKCLTKWKDISTVCAASDEWRNAQNSVSASHGVFHWGDVEAIMAQNQP